MADERLQFGRGTEAAENRPGRRGRPRPGGTTNGVNSAAALRPRRTGAPAPARGCTAWLQFGGGTEAAENDRPASDAGANCRSFNSAAALRPRRTRFLPLPHPLPEKLQFGRGTEAAENV